MTKDAQTTTSRCLLLEARAGTVGFTLVEMVVVIGMIVLIAATALPSIVGIFRAGSDSQAHNLLAAQLTAARAVAIRSATYAGVHVQLADARWPNGRLVNPNLEGQTHAGVVIYQDVDTSPGQQQMKFVLAGGHTIHRIPGKMSFGELTADFLTGADYKASGFDETGLRDFTTFTVVFSPSGSLVTKVKGKRIRFYLQDPVFNGADRLWDFQTADDEDAVTAITMFEYPEFSGREGQAARKKYLTEYGKFLPINVHTGQLFPRD